MTRVCPTCRQRMATPRCPEDTTATVPAYLYRLGRNDPLVGKVFDKRFQVESLIGRGGFGSVYRAQQLAVGREVALKILSDQVLQEPDAARRFQEEARLASRLEHPHSLRIYDFGRSTDGQLYIVTEMLEGVELAEIMFNEGSLTVGRAVEIGCQALDALAEAHDRSLVHRDIKPANLFLTQTRDGADHIKLLDFGLAVAIADDPVKGPTPNGLVLGTPAYISPERLKGLHTDARSDIYSMGVVLHEMLSGAKPFVGKEPLEQVHGHLRKPPPRLGPAHAPAAVADLVLQCLAKDPEERPQSADELRRRLRAAMVPVPLELDLPAELPDAPRYTRQRRRAPVWMATLASAVLSLWLVISGFEPSAAAAPIGAPAAAPMPQPAAAAANVAQRPGPWDEQRLARRKPTPLPIPMMVLTTSPAGALVFDGENLLGETPLHLPVPAPRAIKLEMRGYRPIELRVDSEDSDITIVLRKRARRYRRRGLR